MDRNLSQYNRPDGRDFKPEPPEYDAVDICH